VKWFLTWSCFWCCSASCCCCTWYCCRRICCCKCCCCFSCNQKSQPNGEINHQINQIGKHDINARGPHRENETEMSWFGNAALMADRKMRPIACRCCRSFDPSPPAFQISGEFDKRRVCIQLPLDGTGASRSVHRFPTEGSWGMGRSFGPMVLGQQPRTDWRGKTLASRTNMANDWKVSVSPAWPTSIAYFLELFFLFLSCLFLTMKLIHCYITLRGSRVTITWHWRNVAWTSHGWLLPLRHSWFCFRVRRCVGWLTADQPPISVTFPSQPADCACGIYMAAVAFHPNPMLSRHFH